MRARSAARPGKVRENKRRQRARRMNASGSHTEAEIAALLIKQHHKCANCRKSIRKRYQVDHVMPLARDGSDDIGNIQLLCPTCNQRKRDKDPIVFAQQQGRLL
jgi:5-methylcytosine-specific restriction endonuclease McrA